MTFYSVDVIVKRNGSSLLMATCPISKDYLNELIALDKPECSVFTLLVPMSPLAFKLYMDYCKENE